MIGIKQSPSCFAALGGSCVRLWSALIWVSVACGDKPLEPATDTLVRPATSAPAKVEAAPEPPLPAEGSEIPKGVSPPELSPDEARAQAEPGDGQAAEDLPRGQSAPEPTAKPAGVKASQGAAAKPAKASGSQANTAAPKTAAQGVKASKTASSAGAQRPVAAKVERTKPASSSARVASARQPSAAAAAPIAPAPEPQPVAAPKRATVQVPSTDHVRVDVPAGLQGWLDADDRMRPWLGKAIAVADSCYAKVRADNPSASGEIAVQVTMHENARPSGRVASASPAVSGITMCATTRLLAVNFLFNDTATTEIYTVRVKFWP